MKNTKSAENELNEPRTLLPPPYRITNIVQVQLNHKRLWVGDPMHINNQCISHHICPLTLWYVTNISTP